MNRGGGGGHAPPEVTWEAGVLEQDFLQRDRSCPLLKGAPLVSGEGIEQRRVARGPAGRNRGGGLVVTEVADMPVVHVEHVMRVCSVPAFHGLDRMRITGRRSLLAVRTFAMPHLPGNSSRSLPTRGQPPTIIAANKEQPAMSHGRRSSFTPSGRSAEAAPTAAVIAAVTMAAT